jgi:hypothetical protein
MGPKSTPRGAWTGPPSRAHAEGAEKYLWAKRAVKKVLRFDGRTAKVRHVWGRPVEKQLAIKIPEESLPAMTEKMVRGIVYREDGTFIEPPQKIDFFLVEDDGAKECKELLDRFGAVYKRDQGLEIRRAVLKDGDVYEITLWQQFKT